MGVPKSVSVHNLAERSFGMFVDTPTCPNPTRDPALRRLAAAQWHPSHAGGAPALFGGGVEGVAQVMPDVSRFHSGGKRGFGSAITERR